MRVPFADFKPMHNELRSELDAAYARVLENSNFIQGPRVCSFLKKEFSSVLRSRVLYWCGNGLGRNLSNSACPWHWRRRMK